MVSKGLLAASKRTRIFEEDRKTVRRLLRRYYDLGKKVRGTVFTTLISLLSETLWLCRFYLMLEMSLEDVLQDGW